MKSFLAYTLALICLTIGVISPALADYAAIAEAQTDYIQSHFYDPTIKLYINSYPNDTSPAATWGNGVQLENLADATRYDKSKYSGLLKDFTTGMLAYWDPAGPYGDYNATRSGVNGTDRFYDDNEWLVLGFVDAYEATKDKYYLDQANKVQEFVLSGWDNKLGGGIYWNTDHKTKNTCSNAPAAASCLRLNQVENALDQVVWASKIRTWVNSALLAPDGLYWDNIDLTGKISKAKYTYNTALMLYTDVLLYQQSKDPSYLANAKSMADASIAHWEDPATGSLQETEDSCLFTHLLCLSLIKLYLVSHDIKYLNVVRREASFAERYGKDPSGGFYDHWTTNPQNPASPQQLILSAGAARIFWMLAPFPDIAALDSRGIVKATDGKWPDAEDLFQQAASSDPMDVESHYRLWHVLLHENKTAEAVVVSTELVALSQNPDTAQQLKALGWQAGAQ